MTDTQHRELAAVLRRVHGKVALSSYRCDLNDELYDGWRVIEGPEKLVHSVKTLRQEVLYVNYDLEVDAQCQPRAQTKPKVKPRKKSSHEYSSEPLLV
jgi:DNA adenine methylase